MIVSGLSVGSHTVAFKPISGWNTPGSQTVTMSSGVTTTASGTYTTQTGSLQVTLYPSAAVSAGAQWQVDGGAWQSSGVIVSGLSVGSHTVAFKPISGWNTPGSQTVTISSGVTTTASGTYTTQTGSLQVTLYPSAAVSAGAQWRGWRGLAEQRRDRLRPFCRQSYMAFKPISGWNTPGSQTVSSGVTTTASGTYTTQTGSLQVTLYPSAAVSAGAQWQVDGGAWQSSGVIVSGLSVGNHTVAFKPISGWNTTGSQTVTISSGVTTTTSGTYTTLIVDGSLQVTLYPSAAVSAGAQWQVDGGAWQSSGTTVSGLSVGSHTVAFKPISGWNTPGSQTVTISSGVTTTASGTYTTQTGSLQVTLYPSAAVSAGAQWQVDGGAWESSGVIVSGPWAVIRWRSNPSPAGTRPAVRR